MRFFGQNLKLHRYEGLCSCSLLKRVSNPKYGYAVNKSFGVLNPGSDTSSLFLQVKASITTFKRDYQLAPYPAD
ncbi:hypothetical protein SUGI_0859220 [Cryptomeria japonica]|nr:hypothetical protein SUGI_0859220 [Cryptomeria japonica]